LHQVAGHAAGGADDDVLGSGGVVDEADDLRLAEAAVARAARALDLSVPLGPPAGVPLGMVGGDAIAPFGEARPELLERDAGVAEERERAQLARVELGDVDADEAHGGALEGGLARRREVGEAGPDAEDEGRGAGRRGRGPGS